MCLIKTDVRKIYKTTDGYFTMNNKIKKPRLVAVIHQRDDKAIAVVKLHSKKESRDNVIPNIEIKAKKHKSLTKDSLVEDRLIISRTKGKSKLGIFPYDLKETEDKLTLFEYFKIKNKVNASSKEYKKTRDKTIQKWKRHFK